ncbi:serine hydrolase [Roseimaritima ulvae]|uniref:D-alanyl-D-alanine dipeptidase n=1 Tax=Roseimaritima ulvae TaxID=980254 RepID=A0A5B9QWU9_9BACT|nr:serine hydrolase [Roseimaritima ulvae]QEG38431.1 D-alanyl-D-alanine dipeptidase [Roseimaritima ulvae]
MIDNRLFLSSVFIAFCITTAIAQDQPAPPPAAVDYAAATEKLRAAVEHEVRQKQLPAFSITLVDRDRVVWAEGFGFEDADKTVPASADTVYRVGSISKLLTDIAVMQQVEQGNLDLDSPIQTYLPDFAPQSNSDTPITLRLLMSHRSGLVRESPVGNYFDPTEPSLAETVASLNDTALVYEPNTKTKYSNAAVSVVGAALEASTDQAHADVVRQSILEPLQMDHSSFVVSDAVAEHLATGWMWTVDGRRFEAPDFLLGTGPAGNLYSSVVDLSKFLVCMLNEGAAAASGQPIVQPQTFRQMITETSDPDGRPQGFGIGFQIQQFEGEIKIGHGGAIYGFSTQLEALPERGIGVAAAASLDGTNGVVRRLSLYALQLMKAAQDNRPLPTYQTTSPIAPERARQLVGRYREVDGRRMTTITELAGKVHMQRGSHRYELRASGDEGRIVTDDVAGFGRPVKLLNPNQIEVDGTVFERLPDAPQADIPDRWKGLIGEYGWDHNTLYILEDQGQLFALIEWFYRYPLTEVDQNTFEFPDYGLYHGEGLTFQRDSQGRATGVEAAAVQFDRREVGTRDGKTFQITPVKPIDELRAAALAATPPAEAGDFHDTDLVELISLDPSIKLDIRYATTNNFTGAVFYKQPRAFMQRKAAEAVVRAHQTLKSQGLGLLIHDAYRPWHVTKMFWDATPGELKMFVANPASGSRHNRGCAVDLTLFDLESGQPIEMVAGYDEFSPRSFPQYPGGTSRQRWYRTLLRNTMEAEGFSVFEWEWWHFDFAGWQRYRIGNTTFENM